MTSIQQQSLAAFRGHLRTIQKRAANSNHDGFDIEMRYLREVDKNAQANLDEFSTASKGSNETRNRFQNVKPNEGTMVKLQQWSASPRKSRKSTSRFAPPYNTYINANYVDARQTMGVPFVYIAAQAPLWNTVIDFWRMVYENEVCFIVMLCATQESGKEKSVMYWPALFNEIDCGGFTVYNRTENIQGDAVYRTLVLRRGKEPDRIILHMQHTSWPDQNVPQASAPLMRMIQTIAASPKSLEAPILVHCSGGVGRTGVFIALHIALGQFQLEFEEISIPSIVRFLKLCRTGMVSRKDQYVFLYYATQREMERMIHSSITGTSVMDLLPQEHHGPPGGERHAVIWSHIPDARVTFPDERQGRRHSQSKPPQRGRATGGKGGVFAALRDNLLLSRKSTSNSHQIEENSERRQEKAEGNSGKGMYEKSGRRSSKGRRNSLSRTGEFLISGRKESNSPTSRRDVRVDMLWMRQYLRRRRVLYDVRPSFQLPDTSITAFSSEEQLSLPPYTSAALNEGEVSLQ